ncbi:MAG: oxidoreductase [Clostridiaceae bacterium]|nr:oxidoreductase [Clostridiaceae bacterium]
MTTKIKVGIIGFGKAAMVFHAPIIESVEGLQLTKVVTTNEGMIDRVKSIYPYTTVVSNVEELLQDESIDLVVITTPNEHHVDLASKALLAKKHVIVEKPFTITSKEADELIAIAEKQNCILTVHQNRRWDSDYLTVKELIKNDFLGNIVEYEAHFDRFRNKVKEDWREEDRPGSGILYDLGSHLIDQALCLFGLPQEITADIGIHRDGAKVDDYFQVILHYGSMKAILKAGMLVRETLPHFIVLGNEGSFVKYGMDIQEEALKKGIAPRDMDHWGEEPETIWGTLNTDIQGLHFRGKIESKRGDYRGFYQNVYLSILGKEELKVRPQEARNTIRVIELAIESNKAKRSVPYI